MRSSNTTNTTMWLIRFLACLAISAGGAAYSAPLTIEEADEIALEAYTYAYPLVFLDLMREMVTNVARPIAHGNSPVNRWGHKRAFPDASFFEVPRPNAGTLYSTLFFDVKKEPLIIDIPENIEMIRCPTNTGLIGGRTQTNGKKDYENVHAFMDGFVSMPLSA